MNGLAGYRRSDGRWGFRNHVLLLPLHLAACSAAEEAAAAVPGTVTVRHDWSGDGAPADVERIARTFVGFASHPNVAATVCIGLDESDTEVARTAAVRGATVRSVSLAACRGARGTVDWVVGHARELVEDASMLTRESAPISALCLGLECGGSDAFSGVTANPALGEASDLLVAAGGTSILAETSELIGAEHLLAARAASSDVAADVLSIIGRFEERATALGVDLRGGQPAPGNMEGGLTTIEEKSLGAAKKGGKAAIQSVLDYGQSPQSPGLHIMDTPGNDIEQMVGMVAAGCQVVAFTTGRGTPTGSPVAPCLKIATTSAVFERLADDLDLNAGTILDGTTTLEEVGRQIFEAVLATASGRETSAERHGNREFALSRIELGSR